LERKKRHLILAALAAAFSVFCISLFLPAGPPEETPPLTLTFIANEGAMVETPSHKVIFDALFDKPNENYMAPSPALLDKLEKGLPPFDGIDIVFVTHNHPDHVSIPPLRRFLDNNPQSKLIAPGDLVEVMQTAEGVWKGREDQAISLDMPVNTSRDMEVKGISLKAFRTRHSGDRESPWNIMYLLSMDGRTVFHEGDSDGRPETFSALGLENTPVDLALVHFWFPLNEVGARLIQEWLKPAHIGLIHLPKRLFEDAPTKIPMIADNYPDIFLLKSELEKRTFR
jgi:L-ascorbate metabolism protein UlaG (beta-lactamase superfamily)